MNGTGSKFCPDGRLGTKHVGWKCDMRKSNGAFREDLKTLSWLWNDLPLNFSILNRFRWISNTEICCVFLLLHWGKMAETVALNLKNTLSPEANVRKQGKLSRILKLAKNHKPSLKSVVYLYALYRKAFTLDAILRPKYKCTKCIE